MNGQGGNCKDSGKVRAGERGINPERLEAPKVNICHLIILLRVPHYFAKRTSFYQHLPLEEKRYFSSFSRSLVARERGREGRREGKRERRGKEGRNGKRRREREGERKRECIYGHGSIMILVKLINRNFFLSRKPVLFTYQVCGSQ